MAATNESVPGSPRLHGETRPGLDSPEKDLEIQDTAAAYTGDSRPALSLDASSEINYTYLTFETILPIPNTSSRSRSFSISGVPSQPDPSAFIDPHLWPESRKRVLLVLSCIATFLTAYTAGSYSPPSHLMAAYFDVSQLAVLVGITSFCMGFALAPMVLAPYSEINGRYPVFVASGVVYVTFQAICGIVPDLPGMIVARFFTGAGGSVFSTMVGGVIADLWHAADRNTPMAIYSGHVLLGTGAGPLISAVMTNRLHGRWNGWEWVFWHQAIMGALLMVALVICFKESRGSVLLSKKAKAWNNWYDKQEEAGYFGVWVEDEGVEQESGWDTSAGTLSDEEKGVVPGIPRPGSSTATKLQRVRWIVKEDEERASLGKLIAVSLSRPFHLLFTEPVVFAFSTWVAFAWAVLFLTFSSVPFLFTNTYGWNIEQDGYVFAAMMIGSVLATVIGVWQDNLLKNPQWRAENWDDYEAISRSDRFWAFLRRRFPVEVPESRLYFTCITAMLLPIGLFIFGFTARSDVHWIAPTIGVGLATMGIYSVYLATFNYLADVYHMYASSALAAQSFCRNVIGGIFPLVTTIMFRNMGAARAGATLGAIATALTLVPWVLVFYGDRIRRRSKFAMVLDKTG